MIDKYMYELTFKNKAILKELQELQSIYLGSIDINIESRYDQKLTAIRYCAYCLDKDNKFIKSSKLYAHNFYWDNVKFDEDNELSIVKEELAHLYLKYSINYDVPQ